MDNKEGRVCTPCRTILDRLEQAEMGDNDTGDVGDNTGRVNILVTETESNKTFF